MKNQLQIIVEKSGLEQTKASYILEKFQDYFKIADEWEKKAKMIVVTEESQTADMQMARTGRLFLREKRIAIEKARKGLKEQALREGKAIDGVANVLKALIVPIEEYLGKQEKFVEIQEDKRLEAEKLEAERKAEEERIENERLDKLASDRYNEAIPYRDFWTTDKYDFREMSQVNFESVMADLKKAKADYDKEQERIRQENERLQKEAEEKEREARKEKERHERQVAEERRKAEEERKRQEEALRSEREEAEKKRLEAEKKAKKDQERVKREAEAKAKKEQERLKKEMEAKAETERKEKVRLLKIVKNKIECPSCHHKFKL